MKGLELGTEWKSGFQFSITCQLFFPFIKSFETLSIDFARYLISNLNVNIYFYLVDYSQVFSVSSDHLEYKIMANPWIEIVFTMFRLTCSEHPV